MWYRTNYKDILNKYEPTSLIVDEEHEDVHGANFGQLMILAVEPQNLLQSLGGGFFLYIDGGCIVGAHFAITYTAWPCSGILGIGKQRDSTSAVRFEITADRAENCVKQGGV